MNSEYYIISISNLYDEKIVTYFKHLYSYRYIGGEQRLYITSDRDILKAKQFKSFQSVQKVADRLNSWFMKEEYNVDERRPVAKVVKAELEIKTTEL